jgi:hypothetical protein
VSHTNEPLPTASARRMIDRFGAISEFHDKRGQRREANVAVAIADLIEVGAELAMEASCCVGDPRTAEAWDKCISVLNRTMDGEESRPQSPSGTGGQPPESREQAYDPARPSGPAQDAGGSLTPHQTNEPLTPGERLVKGIREGSIATMREWCETADLGPVTRASLREVFAELDATRAKVAALEAEVARMRPVVEAAKNGLRMCREVWGEDFDATVTVVWKPMFDAVDALSAAETRPKEERT